MSNDKEISIDCFTAEEKVLVALRVKALTARLDHIASRKEEKAILKEAKRLVMKARVVKETATVTKTRKPRKPATEKESEVKAFSWAGSLRKNPRALK